MKRLTTEQAIIVTAYTGILFVRFGVFHKAVEKKLGRRVFNVEFIELIKNGTLREAYQADFEAIVPGEEDADPSAQG